MKKKNSVPKINARIGRWVNRIRRRHSIRQTKLAPLLGLDQSALSRVENGLQQLSAAQLFLLFQAIEGERPGTAPDYRAVRSLQRLFRIRFIRKAKRRQS